MSQSLAESSRTGDTLERSPGAILNSPRREIFLAVGAHMSTTQERVCVGCGGNEETKHLEVCPICNRYFCADCANRALGRRFCSNDCSRSYYYHGESDDDDEDLGLDDE